MILFCIDSDHDADIDYGIDEINHQSNHSLPAYDTNSSIQKSNDNRKKRKQPPTKGEKSKRHCSNIESNERFLKLFKFSLSFSYI